MCSAHVTAVALVFPGNLFLADLGTSEVLPFYNQEMANNLKTLKQVSMAFYLSQNEQLLSSIKHVHAFSMITIAVSG